MCLYQNNCFTLSERYDMGFKTHVPVIMIDQQDKPAFFETTKTR